MYDCRFLDKGNCLVLSKYVPDCEKCSFKQTEKDAKIGQTKSFKRIASLPKVRQQHIADTYYRGAMPWQGD